jgi:type IV secretory pathway TraG/TraD family ATPase VirD4
LIDEFAALAAGQVARLFGRARDAGLSLLLGTQSLADLRVADPDDFSDALTEQVFTNVSFSVVHREADPGSAERLARMAGTKPSWSTTKRTQGRFLGGAEAGEGTRTREREFVVLPDEFKRLAAGEAIVINSTAKPPAQVVKVWRPKIAAELGLGSGAAPERPVSSSRGEGRADWHSA